MSPILLDDELVQEVRELASTEGRSLEELVEEVLRERLARRPTLSEDHDFRLPTYWGGRFKPGVNIESNVALFDLMDLEDAGN